jgi:hypothetical protein
MKATQEQIDAWKKQYGDVFKISVEDKECYVHRPSRKTLSYASSVATKDPIKFNEIMLNGCWIDGDSEIKTDDSLFLSVSAQLAELIQVKEAELVKL